MDVPGACNWVDRRSPAYGSCDIRSIRAQSQVGRYAGGSELGAPAAALARRLWVQSPEERPSVRPIRSGTAEQEFPPANTCASTAHGRDGTSIIRIKHGNCCNRTERIGGRVEDCEPVRDFTIN